MTVFVHHRTRDNMVVIAPGGGGGGTGGFGLLLQVATVSGSYQLQDSNGNPFVVNGVVEWSIADNGNNSSSNSFFATSAWSNIATIVATEKAAGVNLVRLRVHAGYYNSLGSSAKTAYINQIVTRLGYAKTAGHVLMICPWDGTDQGPTGFNYSNANLETSYAQLYPLQNAICAATGNDPDLIWDLVNEPNDNSTGSFTWSIWQTVTKGLINNLRSAGYQGVIVVDPINWSNSGASGIGYSDTNYTAIETYDAGLLGGHHQIVFACHQYWTPSWAALTQGTTGGWSTFRFTGTQIGGTTTHCILVSEVGYDNSPNTGSSLTWSQNVIPALRTLSSTMSNFAGTVAFNGFWVDDNTVWSISDWETQTTWGGVYFTSATTPVNTSPPVIS